MLTTFLFWNLNKKSLEAHIAALVGEHAVDVLILAECALEPELILRTLNPPGRTEFHLPPSLCRCIRIFTRFSTSFLQPVLDADRATIRQLALPACTEVLVAAAHLPSRIWWSEESLNFECSELARMITKAEGEAGHRRTILVGDLNMNPFDKGMVAASGLHAVMSREVASRGERTVQDRQCRFFYNPMWSHFGDHPERPAGTYYYERAEQVTYFWNVFDQVVVRPDLIERFQMNGLRILTSAAGRPLITGSGHPDKEGASDHLPIVFKIDL
jgi:hypothetical protein